jgi:hypothetical protein
MAIKQWLQQSVSSRLGTDIRVWCVFVVSLLLVLGDISHRFLQHGEQILEQNKRVAPKVAEILALEDALHEGYLKKLSDFVGIETNVSDSSIFNIPETLPNALLSQEEGYWQSNGVSYKLVGIFKKGRTFAVINRIEMSSRDQRTLKVIVGTRFDEFKVVEVSMQFVTFISESGEEVFLRLFDRESQPEV